MFHAQRVELAFDQCGSFVLFEPELRMAMHGSAQVEYSILERSLDLNSHRP